jgi:glycerol-1-phosphate dehydrogenase [NAD(P)+]
MTQRNGKTIASLLSGQWRDPDDGGKPDLPIRAIAIADRLTGQEAELVKGLSLGRRLGLVSDPTTHRVLGQRVERALSAIAEVTPVALPERPHADLETVEKVRAATRSVDALIAVGSGTINDLCKYAAFLEGKPYAVFGTAPSMNGYSSANAAITVAGLKKSLAATVPVGIFLDLEVLAAAPARMIRSGLGDSLCRPTAEADWLMASLLGRGHYRRAPFALLAEDEAALFENAAALMAGDIEAMAGLARTLVLSGIGMLICGGSYPASQGEHLISHYGEMMAPADWPASFHGEQIGVATLTMARLQEQLIERAPFALAPTQIDEADLKAHFGDAVGAACLKELKAKALDRAAAGELTAAFQRAAGEIGRRIGKIWKPASVLERALLAVGAPTHPAQLGWSADFYAQAVLRARQIRNRFTFLDLAADSGMIDAFARRETSM